MTRSRISSPSAAQTPLHDNDVGLFASINAAIMEKQQELWPLLLEKARNMSQHKLAVDPMGIQKGITEYWNHYWAALMANPDRALKAQMELIEKYMALGQYTMDRLQGNESGAPLVPAGQDRRFRDPRWTENPLFDHLRQSYLLTAQWVQDQLDTIEGVDAHMARKIRFAARQYMDALAPANFWLTNPEVLDETLRTKGENILKGLENLIADLKKNRQLPRISMVKGGVFEVGKNLATTSGSVVFENPLLQVIQYDPLTPNVYKTPLVIISPWINKFYILDMQAENSFIRWAVEQGHTVFVTSWVNPDESHRSIGFDDYMTQGLMAAIKAAQDATGEKQVNVIGYCIGGTLLTTALAYWKARNEPSPVKSATFFTALVDFRDAGDLTLFIDEQQIAAMEEMMQEKGYLDGWHLATTFNLLRANDLIWSFVINNYLLGREPLPFDLLHWNSDSTGIPAKAHSFYLRQMYLHNNLARPNGLEIRGTRLDVRKIDTPAYFISTIDDHIAPWKATYDGARLFGGKVDFTLAGSGHIAGIVNPPAKNKYGYWTNRTLPANPDQWLDKAEQHDGSWWPHWAKWIASHGGKKVPARVVGKGKLKAIEPAPGRYVKKRG